MKKSEEDQKRRQEFGLFDNEHVEGPAAAAAAAGRSAPAAAAGPGELGPWAARTVHRAGLRGPCPLRDRERRRERQRERGRAKEMKKTSLSLA